MSRIASFIRTPKNSEPLATELEHLRHERHVLEAPAVVERGENLFPAPDFDPIPSPQIEALIPV
jgi:hypothetical protein